MSDWLSKIEEFNKQARAICELELDMEYDEDSPLERMARVIRELTVFARHLNDGSLQTMEEELDIFSVLGGNLSPDAKELLE